MAQLSDKLDLILTKLGELDAGNADIREKLGKLKTELDGKLNELETQIQNQGRVYGIY